MYIRTQEQALEALAGLLDLPERRAQIVQSTVQVMLCLQEEPRRFMADAQALLIQGGLEALRRRRRDLMESQETIPLIVLDPEGDLFFEAAAAAMDALRLAETVRQVFPDLLHARWMVARTLIVREAEVRTLLASGIRARGDAALLRPVRSSLETLLNSTQPPWGFEEELLRNSCAEILEGSGLAEPLHLADDAATLFEILAVNDERSLCFLESLRSDPAQAVHIALRLYECLDAVRNLPLNESRSVRDAA